VQKPREISKNEVIPPNSENPKTGALLHPLQPHGYANILYAFVTHPFLFGRLYRGEFRKIGN